MMMKGDRKKMSMVGEAHLHNDRDQLAPSPARARCGPCGVLVHIALLAHFELVHIVHIYLIGPTLVVAAPTNRISFFCPPSAMFFESFLKTQAGFRAVGWMLFVAGRLRLSAFRLRPFAAAGALRIKDGED